MGHEYAIARPEAAVQMATFGFYVPRWMRSNYPKLTGAGLFDARSFDPAQVETKLSESGISVDGRRGCLLGGEAGGRVHR